MSQKLFSTAPILTVPISIREDETSYRHKEQTHPKQKADGDDDLIFGALDDDEDSTKDKTNEESPSVDEEIQLRSSVERTKKRERAHSSISTVDDEWENMLPITEGDEPLTSANSLQLINEKNSTEHIVGMSNFRAKHRLRRHSKTNTLVRWKEAIKKVVQLKDPW